MAIDWNRFKFLATDGDKSIWTYATNNGARDVIRLGAELPTYPPHKIVTAKSGIAVIFDGAVLERLMATIEKLSDKIVSEGNNRLGNREADDEQE